MSYELASGNKLLGQFASNKGLTDLSAAAKPYAALSKFLRTGKTLDVPGVVKDLTVLARAAQPDVASTARGLIGMMRGKTNVSIIH